MTSSQNDDEAEHDFPYFAVIPKRLRQPVQAAIAAFKFCGVDDTEDVKKIIDALAVAYGFNVFMYSRTDDRVSNILGGGLTTLEKQTLAVAVEADVVLPSLRTDQADNFRAVVEARMDRYLQSSEIVDALRVKYRR